MKIRNALVFAAGAVFTAFVYIILSESFSAASVIVGSVLGIGAMLVCVLFFPDSFLSRYHVKVLPLLWYFICLIFIVIYSGIKTLILSYSSKTSPMIINYESSIKSDMLLTLLANSITLTPGTTTIDKSGSTLRVLKLCKSGCRFDVSDIALLERMIERAEVKVP